MLEDDPEAAPLGCESGHILTGDDHTSRVGRLEARDHAQHRRLAAPGRPQESEDLAPSHREGDVAGDVKAAEALVEVFEGEEQRLGNRRRHFPFPRTSRSHRDIQAGPSRPIRSQSSFAATSFVDTSRAHSGICSSGRSVRAGSR